MKKLLLLAMLICSISFAQRNVGVHVTQDFKLGVLGDKEHGYSAGTLDVCLRVIMEGNQSNVGYVIVFPEFEYANLAYKPYKRWSANAGYMFNELPIENLEAGLSFGYGFIDRGKSDFSFGGNGFLGYKLSDTFKVIAVSQFTQRSDLPILYSGASKEWRFSGHLGVYIKVFETRGRRFNKTPLKRGGAEVEIKY